MMATRSVEIVKLLTRRIIDKTALDTHYIDNLYQRVCYAMYEAPADYWMIEKELGQLKEGGALTFAHLELIADPDIWLFNRWYRWPSQAQIEDLLPETNDCFKQLAIDAGSPHEERAENDRKLFNLLYYKIFKNIELVSIILRFVDPDNFGIYSPPTTFFINSPRGYSYGREYMNFVRELRKYRDIYGLKKVAYADIFLWSLGMSKSPAAAEARDEVLEHFHRQIGVGIRKHAARSIIEGNTFGKSDLEKATFYVEAGDYDTAAKWAGYAFELAIATLCHRLKIETKKVVHSNGKKAPISLAEYTQSVAQELCKNKSELLEVVSLRNQASHIPYHRFEEAEVMKMINVTRKASSW